MNLTARDLPWAILVRVEEQRIDSTVAIQFKDRLRDLTQGGADRVILDLGAVEFVDSSGLGAVVASMKQLGTGRTLELAALTPTVQKVFRLTRMDRVFRIHETADAALAGAAHGS